MNRPFHLTSELASAYLDRELPLPERRRLDLHLETCAHCRARLERLRGTVALLRSVPRSAPPVDLARWVHWDVLAEAVRPAPRRSIFARLARSGWGGLATLATAAVMLFTVGVVRDLSLERDRALALRVPREVVSVTNQGFLFQPPTTSEAAGRKFVWNDDNLWVQEGVRERAPHRVVLASSPTGRRLLARYRDLSYLISGGERVLLREQRDTLELSNG
ncbi:MAG TPA: zf-HC2 domain-containing protein [Thermoanaerobaculia bacterium]|nr:zf-HC2 domain-containing protein [Thermoanaerobaculia bacterium]